MIRLPLVSHLVLHGTSSPPTLSAFTFSFQYCLGLQAGKHDGGCLLDGTLVFLLFRSIDAHSPWGAAIMAHIAGFSIHLTWVIASDWLTGPSEYMSPHRSCAVSRTTLASWSLMRLDQKLDTHCQPALSCVVCWHWLLSCLQSCLMFGQSSHLDKPQSMGCQPRSFC